MALSCIAFPLKDLSPAGTVPQLKTVFALHGPGHELNPHHTNRKQEISSCVHLYSQHQDKEVETVEPLEFSGHSPSQNPNKINEKPKLWRIVEMRMDSDRTGEENILSPHLSSAQAFIQMCTCIHVCIHVYLFYSELW